MSITILPAHSLLNLNLSNILPRHDYQPHKPLLHIHLDIPALPALLMPLRRQLYVLSRRLTVLVGHGEDDVALRVGALHLAGKHAAVGGV